MNVRTSNKPILIKRNRLELLVSMLKTMPDKKTHLQYKNNLSHALLNTCMKMIADKELAIKHDEFYERTEKGNNFIEQFDKMTNYLG